MQKFKKLGRDEMKKVLGGDEAGLAPSDGSCYLRCDQDSTTGSKVADCSSATAGASCPDLSNAVCTC